MRCNDSIRTSWLFARPLTMLAILTAAGVVPLAIASPVSGKPAVARPAGAARAEDGKALMKRAAALEKAGRYRDAATVYDSAAKAFTAAGDSAAATEAYEKSAEMNEKLADALLHGNAPATQPVPAVARPAATRPAAAPQPTRIAQATPKPVVRLAPLARRPGYIIGRAVFEDGRPIPQFHVDAGGFNGKFSPFLNNNLGGPQVRQTGTTFGKADGVGGRYSIHISEDATMTDVRASTTLLSGGHKFPVDLWPTDNLADGTSPGYFRGRTKTGIVRDFILKMDGLRPGYKAAEYPDHVVNTGDSGRFAYYGGEVVGECNWNSGNGKSLYDTYPKGSVITVTLTPNGPRMDGLPGRTVVRSVPHGIGFYLFGVAYGTYTATAQIKTPDGATHNLRVASTTPSDPSLWQPSAQVKWESLDDSPTSPIIIKNPHLYLAP